MNKFSTDLDRLFSLKLPMLENSRGPWKARILIPLAAMLIILSSYLYFSNHNSSNGQSLPAAHSVFASEKEFLRHVGEQVEFDGVSLQVVRISRGDNYWKVAKRYGVDIDTLIGANPYWDNLLAKTERSVIVPSQKGVLDFINSPGEADEIAARHSTARENVLMQKMPFFQRYFRAFQSDPGPIAVFVKGARPTTSNMTPTLAKQFTVREMFRSPLGGRFSSFFGNRVHPIFHRWKFHDGLDIAARYGTPVGAPCGGRVVAAGWMGGYGKAVVIQHPKGYKTLCGHMSRIYVRQGQYVTAGRIIGRVGSTGYSTGPHLHFSLWRNGRSIDPMKVLW